MCTCINCQEACLETRGLIEIIEKKSVEVQVVKDVVETDKAAAEAKAIKVIEN